MLLQDDVAGGLAAGLFAALAFGWLVLILVAGWKMYVKAAQPGWVSIIPFLNLFGLLKIVHRPLWWFVLFIIPIVNIVALVIVMNDLSKAFGRGLGTTLLLIFLTPIGYLILGFGDDRYALEPDPIFG
ncbi:MAG: DUF5684 domain-containing protein [Jiangellales bacterium]